MLQESKKIPDRVLDFDHCLENIRGYFLKEDAEFDPKSAETQKILGAIWYIADSLSPPIINDVSTSVSLLVPSSRLGELGLISEDTAHKISETIKQALEPDPFKFTNTLFSKRIEDKDKIVDGFEITEKYVDVEGFYAINGDGARLDHIVEERMLLTKDSDGIYCVEMEQAITQELHAFKIAWGPKSPTPLDKFQPIEVTPRRLNTTFALFVEGTRKGYIK